MCGAGLRFEYNIVNAHLLSRHQMNFLEYKRRVAAGDWPADEEEQHPAATEEHIIPLSPPLSPPAAIEPSFPPPSSENPQNEENGESLSVQCQLCSSEQLTLAALHAHLAVSHAMRLNESTGELEDLPGQERAVPRRQRYEARHFLLAHDENDQCGDSDDERGEREGEAKATAAFMSNGWNHEHENRDGFVVIPNGLEDQENDGDGALNGPETTEEDAAGAEYSDDPDAMCHQICEMCGAEALVLRNHTRSAHGLNIAQYRELYPAFKFASQVHHR
jgi:hypothetical protein